MAGPDDETPGEEALDQDAVAAEWAAMAEEGGGDPSGGDDGGEDEDASRRGIWFIDSLGYYFAQPVRGGADGGSVLLGIRAGVVHLVGETRRTEETEGSRCKVPGIRPIRDQVEHAAADIGDAPSRCTSLFSGAFLSCCHRKPPLSSTWRTNATGI